MRLRQSEDETRNSSIELCRIFCMMLIVAFHYVHKGLGASGGGAYR